MAVNGTTPVLAVSPEISFHSAGNQGGPFTPGSQIYTLSNSGDATLNFSAYNSQPWLSLSKTGGVLAPGESTTLSVSINSAATALSGGIYSDMVTFENLSNGRGNTNRAAQLKV